MSFTIEFQNRNVLELSQFELSDNLKWLEPLKQNALKQFQQARLPSRKVEHWKYNDMAFLSGVNFQSAKAPSKEQNANLLECTSKIEFDSSIELIFVDGFLTTSIESLKSIDGLTITPFENANDKQRQTILAQLDPEFNAKNLLINLNEAINQNGLLIEVASNKVIETPLYLRYFNSCLANASLSSQKIVLSIAQSSQLTLIEQFESAEQNVEQLSLQQTSIDLSANSRINHYRLQPNYYLT